MSHEPGARPSRLPQPRLSDFMPDRNRSAISDILARNRFFQAGMQADHTTLTVGNTVTQTTDELQRVRSIQVGTVAGGTVTVQVQVDGRDIFADASRPVSGGAVGEPTDVYTFPAGSVISTIIEADSGTPTGTANIVIEAEPFQLLPRSEMVELRGKDRLLLHRRREHELAAAGVDFIERSLIHRTRRASLDAQSTDAGQEQLASEQRTKGSGTVIPRGDLPGTRRPPKRIERRD